MRILFDQAFDRGSWPGPRGVADAVAGAAWLGPQGLLSLLETQLGLAVPQPSPAERAAALVPRLFREDCFYGASARANPWATAQRLLAWRDVLWEHGWRGERVGERRLGELAEVTLGLSPGRAERLEMVAGWLESRAAAIEEVRLLQGREAFSPAWQRVLAALARRGTRIAEEPPREALARGNLARIRRAGAVVDRADRSLQIVRPHGPREAARVLAAALTAGGALDGTVLVNPDGLVDEALAAFGLPTIGARTLGDVNAFDQLLPTTLMLAWSPVDPQRALDWLGLPEHPLPSGAAKRLSDALRQWPAVGGPAWAAARREAEQETAGVAAIVDVIFAPLGDARGEIRARDLLPRVDLVERWAEACAGRARVVEQARALRRRLELAELRRLTLSKLEAVLASVAGEAKARCSAQAGLGAVGHPGGMLGPARRTVWWGFLDSGSSRHARVALRPSERRALASIGVVLPAPEDEVRAAAARARRPLLRTTETLILVAPQHDDGGNPAHPHPLWDEILGKLRDPRDAGLLEVPAPDLGNAVRRTQVAVQARPEPARTHRSSLPVALRSSHSPTSLARLLGCPFAYAVEYLGQLRPRFSPRLLLDSRLFSRLAHEVLAVLARADALAGEEVPQAALQALDRLLPTHAAVLLQPGHHQERMLLRDALSGAAALLGRVVRAEGLRVREVEAEIGADLGLISLRGTPDLVLEDPRGKLVLLDFKWAGAASHRDDLERGTALQLAAYAALLRSRGLPVRTLGYLVLRSHRLMVRGEALAFAQCLSPDLLDATWSAAERAFEARVGELARGEVRAEGVWVAGHTPIGAPAIDGGRLVVPPPCAFCALDLLCGRGA